jgi:fucose permease
MTVSRFIFALTKIKMRTMILLGFSSFCIFMVLLLLFRNQWMLMVIFILLGAALGPVWPMIVGIGTSSFREKSGTVASFIMAAGGLGGTLIPVVIGWVSGRAGFYGGFWLLVLISAIGFFLICFGIRKAQYK